MEPVHVDPRQALAAYRTLHARTSVGMHFGTFQLGDEAEDAAQDEIRAGDEPNFWLLGFGEGRDVD
jgi:L-ascorbate metabolism protein UlaG (beta-lactamase superfamily)